MADPLNDNCPECLNAGNSLLSQSDYEEMAVCVYQCSGCGHMWQTSWHRATYLADEECDSAGRGDAA